MRKALAISKLRRTIDPLKLEYISSEQVKPIESIVGQTRAVKALKTGLGIKGLGYNIYVSGVPGTGKLTAVEHFLEVLAKEKSVAEDWCYVNNFQDSYCPHCLRMPNGRAVPFRQDMKKLVEEVKKSIQRVFESDEFSSQQENVIDKLKNQRNELFNAVNKVAAKDAMIIKNTATGIFTIPMKDEKPMSDEEFALLEDEERSKIRHKQEKLDKEIKKVIKNARELENKANEELEKIKQKSALFAIEHIMDELFEKYLKIKDVTRYLNEVKRDILENINVFLEQPKPTELSIVSKGAQEDPLVKYEVNILVDNSQLKGAPVIIEQNPNYYNLFGRVEKESQWGTLISNYSLIKAGSLHRANGGYLVIPVEDLLTNPFSWDSLKRSLKNKEIRIEEPAERFGFLSTKSLKPEPVDLDVKVILIDKPQLYHLLYELDSDFRELFKIKADFDTSMPFNEKNVHSYLGFVCKLVKAEELLPLDNTAMASIIEYGLRLAENQDKLSTRFGEISNVMREASYYASEDALKHIDAGHIKKAIDEKFYRSALLAEKINEFILNEIISIDLKGAVVGQINGLAVTSMGDISFGRPSRITVSLGIGQGKIIDIEREVKLGGPIHSKGVMILSGYMADHFGRTQPIGISARIVFEQNYGGIDGDSASSTELYALLSAISALPIKQGIAVTGSVNQKGEIQAIGGVNEKIEGYFDICKASGLNKEQGVIIPASNIKDLMLKEEVLEAVRKKEYKIWAINHIDEGIEILTGVPAGIKNKSGRYRKGTIKYLVTRNLAKMAQNLKSFMSSK